MKVKMVKGAIGPIYLDALAIRRQVFVEEQGIDPALEFDEKEGFFTYFVGYDEDECPVVTARVRKIESDIWLVQRVATKADVRHRGLAAELFKVIEKKAQEKEIKKIRLHAQASAEPFYFAMNYERIGGPELEAGIEHYWMEKYL